MKTISRKHIRAGLTLLVAVTVLAAASVVWLRERDDGKKMITAVFANASPLVSGNEVRLYGMKVGTVGSISLVNGKAHVRLDLDESAPSLHRDARAVIRPVSLLGERYVELKAGTDESAFMSGRPVIPASRTSSAVDLDQVLNSLDDPTSASSAALITTLGEGMNGRGADAAAAMKALEPAMTQSGELSDILKQQNRVLTRLIDSASGSTRALAGNRGKTLDKVVASANKTLSTVSRNRKALDGALQRLPQTMAKARRTLAHFGGVADDTSSMLRDVRPVTDDLTDITSELRRFADAADPALARLPKVLNRLNKMLEQARPVVNQLVPASKDLRSASSSVRPLGEDLLKHKSGTPSHLENLLTGAANWGMTTSGYDGLSHYFRGVVGVTPETLRNTAAGALPATGPLDQGNMPKDPHRSDGFKKKSNGKQAPAKEDPSNATGLDPQQEQDLVGQLLGGE